MPAIIDTCCNIEDLACAARRVLPRPLFDYVDAGSFGEFTSGRNVSAFDQYVLRPRVLRDVSTASLNTEILGHPSAMPLMIAPTGLSGLLWPDGEISAARAAHAAGIPYCLSTLSICAMESVRAATTGPLAFQLYVTRDRGLTEELIARAARSGYGSLCVTVDVPVLGRRERNIRNQFEPGSRRTLRQIRSILGSPRWALRMLGSNTNLGNFLRSDSIRQTIFQQASIVAGQFDSSLSWADVQWLRRGWPGRLVLKGILDPEDAVRATHEGVDAVVVSNHGGRQLDGAIASIDALSDVVDKVRDRMEVLFDGGVRRGRHIAIALALGARACLLGRPHLYGLAVAGERGVSKVIRMLQEELSITCSLMGITRVSQFTRTSVKAASSDSERDEPQRMFRVAR